MPLTLEILGGLQLLDSDWRLIPCDGHKRPINPATGEPMTNWGHHTYDADGIAELADSTFVQAVGLVLGEPSGVVAVDFDGSGSTARFRQEFGREWRDLPGTVSWSSGLPNRRQMAYRVPLDLWPHLRGRRVFRNDAGRIVLELRGTGHQSIIAGAHPDTEGYRWLPGCSPADLQVADAPPWLLAALHRATDEPITAEHQQSTSADIPRALDLLAHIRPRDDYDGWLAVGMALHSVDPGLLSDWVTWSRGCATFDEDECLSKWASFKGSGVSIGTLHYMAGQDGYAYRRPQEPQAGPEPAQPGKAAGGTAEPHRNGTGPALDLKPQKPKLRTLSPHDVVEQLPQRIGGIPKLNIRTNDFHAAGKTYSADDVGRIYVHLSSETERWPKETTADVFVELAKDRAFDPVEEYLNRIGETVEPLPIEDWERLDQRLLGIDDPIAAMFLPRFLISAVARVYLPGCGVRRTPVLIGPQWRGKTRLGAILFGSDHWVENITDLGKDDLLRLQSAWGVELSELDGITRRKDQEALKAFLTANDDVFRTPYAKAVARYQRRCVFWGTANGPPLRDLSGSTRFVCIQLPDRMLPLDWAIQHRDAIWARAVALFREIPAGEESWDYATDEERLAIQERNANHQEVDPWADEVAKILRSVTFRPVSIAYVLEGMSVPISQRNNAMAARVRQLAEGVGWVMDRRRQPGTNERARGLWPADPQGGSYGHSGHSVSTPRYGQENSSQELASGGPGHSGHSNSTKLENQGIKETGDTRGDGVGPSAMAAMASSRDPAPQLGSQRPQRPGFAMAKDPIRYGQTPPRRVRAREGGPLPPGTYQVVQDPGGFDLELYGPEGSFAAADVTASCDDVESLEEPE